MECCHGGSVQGRFFEVVVWVGRECSRPVRIAIIKSRYISTNVRCECDSTLKSISQGQLIIRTSEHTYCFPESTTLDSNKSPNVQATITVRNPTFWLRIALTSDMGFAEAFMFGDIECDNLINVFEVSFASHLLKGLVLTSPCLFQIFLLNKAALSSMSTGLSSLVGTISGKITSSRFLGSLANTRSNISSHYDLSNEMYTGQFSVL